MNDVWFQDDITFCGSDCDNLSCFRNKGNIIDKSISHFFADFRSSGECPVEKINFKNNEKIRKVLDKEN